MARQYDVNSELTVPASLSEAGFTVTKGWHGELGVQLIRRNERPRTELADRYNEADVFADYQAASEWNLANTDRVIYALFQHAQLAAVVFVTPAQEVAVYDVSHQLAVREYVDLNRYDENGEIIGDYLEPFLRSVQEDFDESKPEHGATLLEGNNDRFFPPLYNAAENVGYRGIEVTWTRFIMKRLFGQQENDR